MTSSLSPELLQLMVTFGLFILIWIIQIIHYPSFVFYGDESFTEAMIFHQRRISCLAIPLMISEVIFAVYIFYQMPGANSGISLTLLLFIWLSTFFIQVPLHERLLARKDLSLINRLVKTNWLRTILWSLKLVVLIIGL